MLCIPLSLYIIRLVFNRGPNSAVSRAPGSLSEKSVEHKEVFENVILYADCGNFLHCFCLIFHAVRYLNTFLEFGYYISEHVMVVIS